MSASNLPDAINQSYVTGTPIASQDLNDLQKWQAEAWAIIRHASLSIVEDFVGPNLAVSGVTTPFFTDAGSATAFAFVDDSTHGASGAIEWTHAAGTSGTLTTNATSFLALGQSDLYLEFSCRIPSLSSAASSVIIAIGNLLELTYNNSSANWQLTYNGTTVNTGIPVATSTTYQKMSLFRTGGVISVLSNGGSLFSVSPSAFDINGVALQIAVTANGSGTTTAFFDYIKLWSRTAR